MVSRASILIILGLVVVPANGEIIVPVQSAWSYLADGSDQGTGWREPDFDDSAWPTGAGPIGYGDPGLGTTLPLPLLPRPLTLYFRHHFNLENAPTGEMIFRLALRRDDGAVVSLNGVEIRRDNMPSGPIRFDSPASTTVGGEDELRYFETTHFLTGLARQGRNVLAVELHNSGATRADAVFDLALERLDAPFSRFLSKPPTAVTFEQPERSLGRGTGVVRRLDSTYTGWDYARIQASDPPLSVGSVFQTLTRSLTTGAGFPSSALCLSAAGQEIRTAPATLANFRNAAVSIELLAERVAAFAAADFIRVDLFLFLTGHEEADEFVRVPWLEIGEPAALPGEAPVTLSTDAIVSPTGTFTRFDTPPGLIPDSASAIIVRILVRSASLNTAFYLDNISLSGIAIEPEDYSSFMRIRGGEDSVPPPTGDLDADGLDNFLEYALGGDPFHAGGTPNPTLAVEPDGFVEFAYPQLPGVTTGDIDRGLQVADVRYRVQFSPNGRQWFDGLGAPLFSLLSPRGNEGTTVRLRSLFPLARENPTGLFRILTQIAPPVRGATPLADPFAQTLIVP
jgi:hypothetical protein